MVLSMNIDLQVLIDSNIVPIFTKKVKLINTGSINKAVTLKGLSVTEGAKLAIESVGGKVEA